MRLNQHKQNDAIESHGEHRIYEAAAGVTWHAVLQAKKFLYKYKEDTLR